MTTIRCHKCRGTGRLRAFAHIDSGKCFTCHGAGSIEPETVSVRSVNKGATSPIEALRSLYRAGASRTGSERREWAVSIAEPFDSHDDRSPLTGARAMVARLSSDEAAKVRAAFAGLGVVL